MPFARRVYVGLSIVQLVAVVAQFYFAGVGAFSQPQTDTDYGPHRVIGGMVIPLVALLATVAAALARAPGRLIGLTIAPLGLVVVQLLIVGVGTTLSDGGERTTPAALAILGLHALNGLAIMAVAGTVLAQARRLGGPGKPAVAAPNPDPAASA